MVFGQKSKAAETRFGQMVSWCLAVDYDKDDFCFGQIPTLLCGGVQISRERERETSTFAYQSLERLPITLIHGPVVQLQQQQQKLTKTTRLCKHLLK